MAGAWVPEQPGEMSPTPLTGGAAWDRAAVSVPLTWGTDPRRAPQYTRDARVCLRLLGVATPAAFWGQRKVGAVTGDTGRWRQPRRESGSSAERAGDGALCAAN